MPRGKSSRIVENNINVKQLIGTRLRIALVREVGSTELALEGE